MKKSLLLLISFVFFNVTVWTQQIEKFSSEPAQFLTELTTFMTAYKDPKIIELCTNLSNGFNTFPAEQKDLIISNCNRMLALKMKPKPDFQNYLGACLAGNAKKDQSLTMLNESVSNFLAKPKPVKTDFKKLVQTFNSLYATQSFTPIKKGKTVWSFQGNGFEHTLENDTSYLIFKEITLLANRLKDSLVISNVEGKLNLISQNFVGSSGKINWSRSGHPEIEAEIFDFTIPVNKAEYQAKRAILTYESQFPNEKIEGKIIDKLSSSKNISYPRFSSTDGTVKMNELGSGIQFIGGFKLEGLKVIGYGTEESPAIMKVVDDETGQLFLNVKGTKFTIVQDKSIHAQEVNMAFYFDKDSITHQSINLEYDISTTELVLQRGKKPSEKAQFYNSLHEVYMDVDRIDWTLGSETLFLGKPERSLNSSKKKSISIASKDNFDISEFTQMQGAADYNPISILKVMTEKEGTNNFDALMVAKRFNPRFTISSAQTLFFDMVKRGFITYDIEKEEITVTDKLIHYGNAIKKEVDFDFLKITSTTNETNAIMNLSTKDIDIKGAQSLELSKTQKVAITPRGGDMTLQKGRDIIFNGKVIAGYTSFTGLNTNFDYNDYVINLDSIKYMDIYRLTGDFDELGKPIAHGLASRIQSTKGTLYIDDPNNKSGREKYPEYPKFESSENAYVYYEDRQILNKVYKKDSFYYRLKPFVFESLDSFAIEEISFKGELISANIFEPIKQNLVAMEDNSLGFEHDTKGAKYPAYRGKGGFNGNVKLDRAGFTAKGEVSYLGVNINADDIIFMPSLMTCSSESIALSKGNGFPDLQGEQVKIAWKPQVDSMDIASTDTPFQLFNNNNHTLAGIATITPEGLVGNGVIEWDRATMNADVIKFGNNSFQSDSSSLKIKNLGGTDVVIETSDVNTSFDLDKKEGKVFTNNEKGLEVKMPENQYITLMDGFDWDLATEKIKYKSRDNQSTFISTHPKQDSLLFKGTDAEYDMNASVVNITGVKHIVSSDAKIILKSQKVTIQPKAVLDSFENVKIIAGLQDSSHIIMDATVAINGRRDFKGYGNYQYNIPSKKQSLFFSDIIGKPGGKGKNRDEKPDIVRGSADVSETKEFYIEEKIKFEGKIEMDSRNRNLSYDGYANIEMTEQRHTPFAIQCEADKNNLFLDFLTPKSKNGDLLHCGIYYSKEFSIGYPVLIGTKLFRKDRDLLEVEGKIHYDRKNKLIQFGDSARMVNPYADGTILSYDEAKDIVYGDGKLGICDATEGIVVTSAGLVEVNKSGRKVDTYLDSSYVGPNYSIDINGMVALEMNLPSKLSKIILSDMASAVSTGVTPNEHYKKYLSFLFPDEKSKQESLSSLNAKQWPKAKSLKKFKFVFGEIPLVWDQNYRSYGSPQGKASLIAMDGNYINKQINAFFEFKMPTSEEDKLSFLIEGTSGYWYFFSFSENELLTTSNNPQYTEVLDKMKPKEMKMAGIGGSDYFIEIEDVSRGNGFKKRVSGFKK